MEGKNEMAAINKDITEQELNEIYHAFGAIEMQMHPDDIKEAREGARQLTIGVFRNLFTPDSVNRWIASRTRELFNVAVEKGHGNIQ